MLDSLANRGPSSPPSQDGGEDARALREQLLEVMGDALEQMVVPELTGTSAGVVVDLVLRLLNDMARWEGDYPALHAQLLAEEQAVERIARDALSAEDMADDGRDPLHVLMDNSAQQGDAALACLTRLWRAEWTFRDSIDPEVRTGRTSLYGGGALPRNSRTDGDQPRDAATDEPTITAPKLQAYLRATRWPGAIVDSLRLLPGGFGKETSRASVRVSDIVHDIVIRRDLPNSANGYCVVEEMPVIDAVFAAGVAAAEPLWLETTPVFDTPFLVSRAMPGATDPAPWRDDPAAVARFAEELGRNLARLHGLPPVPTLIAGSGALTMRDWIIREIDLFGGILAQRDDAPSALLPAAFTWTRANVPDSGASPRVLHGDVGFHNMLMQDGHITALIDWEYAHLGDPQQELNYVRPFVEELGAWDAFLGAYTRHGGVPYRDADRAFWQSWTGIRTSIGCVGAMRAFQAGHYANPDAALKLAVAGLNFGPRHLLYSIEDLVGVPRPVPAPNKGETA